MTVQDAEWHDSKIEPLILSSEDSRAISQSIGQLQGESKHFATKADIEALKNWITWRIIGIAVIVLVALYAAWRDIISQLLLIASRLPS